MTTGADPGLEQLLLVEQLRGTSVSRRHGHLMRFLRQQIARRLLLHDADVDSRVPLISLGMSSLQALELKQLLEQQLGLPLSSSLVFDYPTLAQLVPRLLELTGLDEKVTGEVAAERPGPRGPILDDPGDVIAQLAAELAELRERS
jgi:acyl carrier protein